MTEAGSSAENIVARYHRAWTSGNLDGARALLADDLDFQGSIDTFSGADDFIEALRAFLAMVVGVRLLCQFNSGAEACLLYDCETASDAGTIRTAEFFRVEASRIREIRLVYDATELRKVLR